MDLSWVKWPVLILVVGSAGFLISPPGIDYMYARAIAEPAGVDPERDAASEASLTRLGGILLSTFRYGRAAEIYETAIKRYPNGENSWYNYYQLARCYEKQEKYSEAVDILVMLRDKDADKLDERIPSPTQLDLRIQKLIEVHELQPRPWSR